TLFKAKAEFARNNETDALNTLAALRKNYPKKDAAISSYLVEAVHYELQEKIDQARKTLVSLIDNPDPDYKKSAYYPRALYRLAELSERLGREENLKEARQRIEDLLEILNKRSEGAQEDLAFAARLKEGDIFRKLNDFPSAQRAYDELVNKYPRRP